MPHATRPGDVLADRYRLVDLLTESGEGRFWRAHDRVLERHVALHVIHADDERAPRLMEAARRSATVLDRRILRVLDADITDDVCYVVNEWGWGASLDIVVAGTGALGPRRSAWLVSQVAEAVAVAHDAGVAHGRLSPENVLIDRTGGVRLIGLCVDAALRGLPDGRLDDDVTDLAGLLYCALTTKWAGTSGSLVAAAPTEHGEVLRPRRVRAGIPRSLDALCDEVLHPREGRDTRLHREPGRELGEGVATARAIGDYLGEFVGDPTGMADALVASTPDVLPDEELVVLPPVPEMTVREAARIDGSSQPHPEDPPATTDGATSLLPAPEATTQAVPLPGSDDGTEEGADDVTVVGLAAGRPDDSPDDSRHDDLPTEAGMPIFGEDDDVSWLERRSTPVPPPPPFEEPPERPLFAPEPAEGGPVRRSGHDTAPRPVVPARTPAPTPLAPGSGGGPSRREDFWPWDTGTGRRTADTDPGLAAVTEEVPGRNWFRLALALSAGVLLLVAVVVAFNVGRGRTPLGGESQAEPTTPSPTAGARTTPAQRAVVLEGLEATAYDPQGGDGEENDDDAPLAVDGDPATSWPTQTYNDQFGPPLGLKEGVGVAVDLGEARSVSSVRLTFEGSPTDASIYVTGDLPATIDDLEPTASGTAEGTDLRLDPDQPVEGRYVVVWLTALPADGDGFRARLAEVEVRGA